jgi:hypothetical protein
MAENGFDLATWLAIPGVFLLFFGLPMGMLEYDRRKKLRQNKQGRPDASSDDDERTAAANRRGIDEPQPSGFGPGTSHGRRAQTARWEPAPTPRGNATTFGQGEG